MPPRFSLWLLPPPSATEVDRKLSDLISSKVPSLFQGGAKPPNFAPHITLATGINETVLASKASFESWPTWLDSLDLEPINAKAIQVIFTDVQVGNTFTKKCYLQVQRTMELEVLARQLQVQIFGNSQAEAVDWMQNNWDPHLSLLYWDGQISEAKSQEVKTAVVDGGFNILQNGGEGCEAWVGGTFQLVDTSTPVEEWAVLASRDL